MKLSAHLCGGYTRSILMGVPDVHFDLGYGWNMFSRVQINTHGVKHRFDAVDLVKCLNKFPEREFIFQFDNVNGAILNTAIENGVNCSTLFDLSHGAGVLPDRWPRPLASVKCGYAGGISPDNIEEQIRLIEQTVGDVEVWIDMETHVRSNNDWLFDLDKVEKCLSIAAKHVVNPVK